MELTAAFKQTDIGPLPSDWDVVPLGELVTRVEYGSSAKSRPKGRVPVLRMGNLQHGKVDWGDLVYTDNEEEIERYTLHDGEVLFNRTNTVDLVGKTAIYEGRRKAIFAGYLIRVVTQADKLDARYLNYVMNTELARKHSAKVLSVAVGQANINGQKLRTYPIPLPPTLAEQESIARALGDADALLDRLDQLIAKKRDLRIAVMQQLLSGRTRLSGFGDAWEERVLGEHVRFLKNGVNPRADLRPEGHVRYLHYGDIHTSMAPLLDIGVAKMPRLPDAMAQRLDRLEDGDLVFVDASEDLTGVGKSVEISGANGLELVSGLHTIAVRFDKDVLADGFKGYLQFCSPFRDQLARLAQGTKVLATTRQHIASVVMSLPGVDEQRAIARVLSESEREILALEAVHKKTTDVKLAMSQELLTGRTRLLPIGGANG